jgi:hypothetical protein
MSTKWIGYTKMTNEEVIKDTENKEYYKWQPLNGYTVLANTAPLLSLALGEDPTQDWSLKNMPNESDLVPFKILADASIIAEEQLYYDVMISGGSRALPDTPYINKTPAATHAYDITNIDGTVIEGTDVYMTGSSIVVQNAGHLGTGGNTYTIQNEQGCAGANTGSSGANIKLWLHQAGIEPTGLYKVECTGTRDATTRYCRFNIGGTVYGQYNADNPTPIVTTAIDVLGQDLIDHGIVNETVSNFGYFSLCRIQRTA